MKILVFLPKKRFKSFGLLTTLLAFSFLFLDVSFFLDLLIFSVVYPDYILCMLQWINFTLKRHCCNCSLSLSQFFWLLLDIVLYLCEKEHVEGGMIFQLLEDLTEMSTMRNCKDIFAYIESKQDILGKVCSDLIVGWWNSLVLLSMHGHDAFFLNLCFHYTQQELFARGKLVMLRTCNQLLRRLSKVVLIYLNLLSNIPC